MRIFLALLLFLAFVVPFGVACNESTAPTGAIVDDMGRAIELDRYPERIVSLAPSCTEMLFALGLGDKVVGDTTYCNYPEEALSKEKVGGFSPSTWNTEKILELQPDLVIVSGGIQLENVAALEKLGLTVFVVDPRSIEDVLGSLETLGKLTGREKEAQSLTADMRRRIDAVVSKTQGMSDDQRRKVFLVVWSDPLGTYAGDVLETELIEKAGGTNIANVTGKQGYVKIDLEIVIQQDPQVMVAYTGMGTGGVAPLNWAENESRLAGTAARMEDRIYEIDINVIGHAGPRTVDALEQLAKCLHPEIFGE
jgi:iron complex transport system substrate-binding protein